MSYGTSTIIIQSCNRCEILSIQVVIQSCPLPAGSHILFFEAILVCLGRRPQGINTPPRNNIKGMQLKCEIWM